MRISYYEIHNETWSLKCDIIIALVVVWCQSAHKKFGVMHWFYNLTRSRNFWVVLFDVKFVWQEIDSFGRISAHIW